MVWASANGAAPRVAAARPAVARRPRPHVRQMQPNMGRTTRRAR